MEVTSRNENGAIKKYIYWNNCHPDIDFGYSLHHSPYHLSRAVKWGKCAKLNVLSCLLLLGSLPGRSAGKPLHGQGRGGGHHGEGTQLV